MTLIIRLLIVAALAGVGAAASAQTSAPLSGSGATQPGVAAEGEAGGPFSWMMPKMTMPKMTMPKFEMPKMPKDFFAPVKNSAAKVKDGASRAWQGTKEIFTFGRDGERVAARETAAGGGAFGAGSAGGETPQTMSEWMAQKRPD